MEKQIKNISIGLSVFVIAFISALMLKNTEGTYAVDTSEQVCPSGYNYNRNGGNVKDIPSDVCYRTVSNGDSCDSSENRKQAPDTLITYCFFEPNEEEGSEENGCIIRFDNTCKTIEAKESKCDELGGSYSSGNIISGGDYCMVTTTGCKEETVSCPVEHLILTYSFEGGYMKNGSITLEDSYTTDITPDDTITIRSAMKSDATFLHWSGNDGKTYTAGSTLKLEQSLTLTAVWNETTVEPNPPSDDTTENPTTPDDDTPENPITPDDDTPENPTNPDDNKTEEPSGTGNNITFDLRSCESPVESQWKYMEYTCEDVWKGTLKKENGNYYCLGVGIELAKVKESDRFCPGGYCFIRYDSDTCGLNNAENKNTCETLYNGTYEPGTSSKDPICNMMDWRFCVPETGGPGAQEEYCNSTGGTITDGNHGGNDTPGNANGNPDSGDNNNDNENIENPGTGNWMLYVVYVVAAAALVYTGFNTYKLAKSKNSL